MSQYFSKNTIPLEAALDYASRGVAVFPMQFTPEGDGSKGRKTPLCMFGLNAATTDPEKVREWWTSFPTALIGVPTGMTTGLFVIDIDGEIGQKNWKNLAAEHGFDPDETLCETSLGGRHYYYIFPVIPEKTPGCTTGALAAGIDTKGEGGSIIISPSAYTLTRNGYEKVVVRYSPYAPDEEREIKILPESLLKLILEHTCAEDEKNGTESVSLKDGLLTHTRYGVAVLKNCCDAVLKETGERCRNALFIQARTVARYIAGGEIKESSGIADILAAGKKAKIPEKELDRILREAFSSGLSNPKSAPQKEISGIEQLADQKETKEAEAVVYSRLPELPMECLPDDVQALIHKVCRAVNCDTWMPFAVLLKAVAACVGANVLLEHSAFTNPTHQWIVLICESGTGKSAVNEYISRPIIKAQSLLYAQFSEDMEAYEQEKMKWETRVKAKMNDKGAPEPGEEPKKPVSIEYYVDDITPESLVGTLLQNPSGVVWDSDEFATWIRSFGRYAKSGGGDPAKSRILGMYDGHTISYKRVKNNGVTDQVKKAWLSVFGTVQPGILPKLVTAEDFDSGFLQRFLFICSDPPPPTSLAGRPRLDDQDPLVDKIITPMLNWKRLEVRGFREEPDKPVRAYLQGDSEFYLNNFFESMSSTYYHMGDEFARTRARRWQAQCVRLILALHCLDRALSGAPDGGGVVKSSTVENGVCIFKCLMEHAIEAGEKMKTGPRKKKIAVNYELKDLLKHMESMMIKNRSTGDFCFDYSEKYEEDMSKYEELMRRLKADSKTFTRQELSKKLEAIGFLKSACSSGVRMSISPYKFNKIKSM